MASSSAVADVLPRVKYDVFISFRGEDTRNKFTSYLYYGLMRKKIETFMDDSLETGDEIGHALMEAIQQSRISIIVFSKRYADSKWCLNELVHIMKCKEKYAQIVIPVFYEIEPTHVRSQSESYADAFVKHEKESVNMDKVILWKGTLTAAANLSGCHSSDKYKKLPESAFVDTIIEDVSKKLNRSSTSTNSRGLFGIESQIQQITSLLSIQSPKEKEPIQPSDVSANTRSIGIWGASGIGKTTIAKEVFRRLYSGFDSCSFIEKVGEQSEKHGMNHVRDKLLGDLLNEKNLKTDSQPLSSHQLDKLSRTKVLVVLDDVTDSSQIQSLLGDQVEFDWGSRIIITSRDESLLLARVDKKQMHTMNKLKTDDALELFHMKASKHGLSKTDCLDLSRRAVEISGGIPLFVTVLSSSFGNCETREEWEDEFRRWDDWEKFPCRKIEDWLRPSYNGLADDEKAIFLDTACFFKGEMRGEAERKLQLYWFSARRTMKSLINKSLISVSNDDHLEMHDFVQEMGQSIVREECLDNPGLRSRLWIAEDVYKVLKNKLGSTKLQAIRADISDIPQLDLDPGAFQNMHNLWFLQFYVQPNGKTKLDIPRGLEFLPEDLKYLYWEAYPSKCLPSTYAPYNLVELHLPNSKVKSLWNDKAQIWVNLKTLNLKGCKHLTEDLDFSQCPNIETLILSSCTGLEKLYVKELAKLTTLRLSGCRSLKSYPELPCNLHYLDLSCCELTELPDLSRCSNLEKLYLYDCKKLVRLGNGYLKHLTKLTTLNMAGCSRLKTSPEIPSSLHILDLSSCYKLTEVPDFSRCPNIEEIDLCWCTSLAQLPILKGLQNLTRLLLVGCCGLKAFPDELPRNVRHLDLSSCSQLTEVPDLSKCTDIEEIDLCQCTSLVQLPKLKDHDKLLRLRLAGCLKLKVCPELPCSIQYLNLSACSRLTKVPNLSGCSNIEKINLGDCTSLVKIPDSYVINLDQLTTLYLNNCSSLEVFPKMPRNVRNLDARYCSQVTTFPDISGCHNIEKIDLSHCTRLVHVDENLDFFQYPNMKIRLDGCTSLDSSIIRNFSHLKL